MSRAVYEERQVKKLKDLLNWAKSFVFKNQELANSYETPESIELSNYYIACKNDTLPYIYKYDRKGFPEDLNEYNLMANGQQFYIEAYELNTTYVGNDPNRFKQVRSSVHNYNMHVVDPPYKGNIFEVNPYYRGLYCEFGLDIVTTRSAKDYSLLYYDSTYVTANINVETFLDLYTKNREWFAQVMENKALTFDNKQRQFNCMFITLITIFAYMDADLQKQFSYDLLDQYDIRNALYSFGITFLNDLPLEFQLRVLKNVRKLIKTKGTDQLYKIITEDIFGGNLAKIYKYYLYRDLGISNEDAKKFNNGTLNYDTFKGLCEKANLFFIKVPYDVYDVTKYIHETPAEEIQTFPFNDIAGQDAYWDIDHHGADDVNKQLLYPDEKVKSKITYRSWIESKYIDINTEISSVPDVQGLILFFSMLHETKYNFPVRSNTLKDPNMDLFGLFACTLYLTKIHIDPSISDIIPPNSIDVTSVLATYLDKALDSNVFKRGENYKYKSLTFDNLEYKNIRYCQPKDERGDFNGGYSNDTSLESQPEFNGLHYGFAQHFKNNFEILKGLNDALMAVAFDDDDVAMIDIPASFDKDYDPTIDNTIYIDDDISIDGKVIKSLASRIDGIFKGREGINPINHEDVYAEVLYKSLADAGLDLNDFKNTPWLKTIIERALLIWNEDRLFESRDMFTANKYGYFNIMSIESYLAMRYPIAYAKLADVILGNKKSRTELLMSLYDDITYTLADVKVYTPPPNGKALHLTKDVNFKPFMQEYVITYAVKLLEYLKSYTVQIHSSGTIYDLTNKGTATIQMHDLFSGDLHRNYILDEYIFTGKNPQLHMQNQDHIEYDTDRVGENYANTTHERLLDEVQVTIKNIANQKIVNVEHTDTELISHAYNPDMVATIPDIMPTTGDLQPMFNGYESHENSLAFKESLFCRVVTPTTADVSQYPLYKKDAIITVVGGPVLVSNTSNRTNQNNP